MCLPRTTRTLIPCRLHSSRNSITAFAFVEDFLCDKWATVIKNDNNNTYISHGTSTATLPTNDIILLNMQDDGGAWNAILMKWNIISFIDNRLLFWLLLRYMYRYVRIYVFTYKEQSCSSSGESNWKHAASWCLKIRLSCPCSCSCFLYQTDQFCHFSKFLVSPVSSETGAGSPQGRSDTHLLNPPQKATGKQDGRVQLKPL